MSEKNRIKFGDGKEVKIAKKTHVNHRKKERDEALANKRKKDMIKAGEAFFRWKRAFLATECLPEAIPGRMVALRDQLARQIKSARIRALVLDLIDSSIEKAVAMYGDPKTLKIIPPMAEGGEK